MSGILNRALTNREKGMLLALVIILIVGLYFYCVHFPVVNGMEEVERDTAAVETQLTAARAKAAEYADMQAELEEIFSKPTDQISILPPYSNIETLMRRLDVIFAGTNPDFSFGQASISDNIASRNISFSCTANDYAAARRILRDVTTTGYRSLLNSFTFSPVEGELYTGPINVSGVITFYELVPEVTAPAAEQGLPAEGA